MASIPENRRRRSPTDCFIARIRMSYDERVPGRRPWPGRGAPVKPVSTSQTGQIDQAMLAKAESWFAEIVPEPGSSEPAWTGRRIGAYRIVSELGRGGMSAVYRAVRDDGEFQRDVAIKIVSLLPGAASSRHFQTEKRILAGLKHPNIGQLIDAGWTGDGLPYLVMELIEGCPIDSYCRSRNPSTEERIRLMIAIADAVGFAHQNLVVHRDIKPANILVTGDGTPKLLDFGISKAIEPEGEFVTASTRLMTLCYASPEQVRGDPVTTACDVYSLGLVLYELLTGRCAVQGGRPLTDLVREVCEIDPPRPSLAVESPKL